MGELGLERSRVEVCELESKGRYLLTTGPVRRGEALIVEDPLYLSSVDFAAWSRLAENICDSEALAATRERGRSDGRLPVSEELTLTICEALFNESDLDQYESFDKLRGDPLRWAESASRLHGLLRPDVQASISREALTRIYSIVAANAHDAEGGRAGVFALGSMCEHSCSPSAFKEVANITSLTSSKDAGVSEKAEPKLIIRALRDLAAGEIVSLSYIPEYQPTWKRKSELQAMYGFQCVCPRCTVTAECACTFVCPDCEGPCSPTTPSGAGPGDFSDLTFTCEDCCAEFARSSEEVLSFTAADKCTIFGDVAGQAMHPYHHKIVSMYTGALGNLPAHSRAAILQQLLDANCRSLHSDTHPLLARMTEKLAEAQMECGQRLEAAASFKDAADMFAKTHHGYPDVGHVSRCERNMKKCER